MAKEGRPRNWPLYTEEARHTYTTGMIPFARIAVAKMAEAYEEAYFSNYPGTEEDPEYKMWNDNCLDEMIEYGLMPNKKETK